MPAGTNTTRDALLRQGVVIRCPETVDIHDCIVPSRIAPGVVIHAGCRLAGASTSIGPGCVLGEEGPVTLDDCQLGHQVRLRGGAFSGATFLDGVDIGNSAHVRPGTLLEEEVACGHAVGLKQTLLMPYVTLGSLINFCDCLMAGGTGPKNHSEVGSSYVHFNFTAHQDKATPSSMGDVPRGVRVDSPPIFLGGQGGMVGPCRIAYGTVTAAGTINRRDVSSAGLLVFGQTGRRVTERPYDATLYGDIERILLNNFLYIANLHALDAWYQHVRTPLMAADPWRAAACAGARGQLAAMVRERCKQLGRLAEKVARSLEAAQARHDGEIPAAPFALHTRFTDRWLDVAPRLLLPNAAPQPPPDVVPIAARLAALESTPYLARLETLTPAERQTITDWLQALVDARTAAWSREFEAL